VQICRALHLIRTAQYKGLWSLYHLFPADDYKHYEIKICCNNALKRLRDSLLLLDVQRLWILYYNTAETMGTLRGIRFEAYAHKKILVEGISMTARKLDQDAISRTGAIQVVIPSGSQVMKLQDNVVAKLTSQRKEAHQNGGRYLLPVFPNYPVIDSAFVSDSNTCYMLQMKASRSWQKM
jgi:hypothetical protein